MVTISVENRTEYTFKATSICFGEIEASVEKYWEPNSSHLIIHNNEKIQIGKLAHSGDLINNANIVVTVILSLFNDSLELNYENFIALKARIKGSIKSSKIYSYASSFPIKYSITKPCWRKGSSKVTYFCRWNNCISFLIEECSDKPIFTQFLQLYAKENEHVAIDEIFENQWKNSIFGEATYSRDTHRMICSRSSFSSINRMCIRPLSQIMPPTSLWTWIDEWHLDTSMGDENGWVYLDNWHSSVESKSGVSKFRFRRWIRTRMHKNNDLKMDNELHFIYEKVKTMIYGLHNLLRPFYKKLKRDVEKGPSYFDFNIDKLKEIPSPKLRRKVINENKI